MTPLLSAHNISKRFAIGPASRFGRSQLYVQAVNEVDIQLFPGQTLGLVGESGCGKSTLARLLALLYRPDQGQIVFNETAINHLSRRRLKAFRRQVQIIFQDPFSSLNPRLPLSAIVTEPLVIHGIGNRSERQRRGADLLAAVGLDAGLLERYPHEFSGGQRQRIAIARALALEPALIIADEPLSALDVSVQSQILNLLAELQQRLRLSYFLISHDLAVIDHFADRIAVMYLGRIVETANRDDLFRAPAHPYTTTLIKAVPVIRPGGKRRFGLGSGDVPSPLQPPSGCPYHPRCVRAQSQCRTVLPVLAHPPQREPTHRVACHFPEDV